LCEELFVLDGTPDIAIWC